MKIRSLIIKNCLIIGAWLLVIVPSAHAQSAGLAITPPVVEILLAPNKKVVQAFTITNQGESGQFVAELHAVKPDGIDGHVYLDPEPIVPSEIPIIVTLQNSQVDFGKPFILSSGASTQLVIGIEGSSVGESVDTYLALVISTYGNSDTPVTTSAGISSLIFTTLTPTGTFPVNLEVSDFEPPLILDSASTLTLNPIVTNQSNVMLRVQGSLTALSPRGNHNQDIPIYPTLILGDSSRRLTSSDGDDPPHPLTLAWKPSISNFGPYRLRLTVTTVGGTTIQEIERTVWVLPIKTTLIIIVFSTLTIFLVLRKRRPSIDTNA